jgi:hypothetical protein
MELLLPGLAAGAVPLPLSTKVAPPRRERVWLFPKYLEEPLAGELSLGAFHCPCRSPRCAWTLVHPRLVEALDTLRALAGRPLELASAYRCTGREQEGGGRPGSFHTRGMAADLRAASLAELDDLAAEASRIGAFGGLGLYPARGVLHLDVRPRPPAGPVRWSR